MSTPDRTSFTDRIRQELSSVRVGSEAERQAELAALLHLASSLHLRGAAGDPHRLTIELETSSGAVARRAFALLQETHGVRPVLRVRAPGGVRTRTGYRVDVEAGAREVAAASGLLDADGRPVTALPPTPTPPRRAALLRGAFLAAGSVSRPGGPNHLEIRAPTVAVAETVADVARAVSGGNVGVSHGDGIRVVAKSGETIGALLAAMGATNAFLEWDDRRLRRSLRNEANRLANADAANLRRTVEAAAAHTRVVEEAVARVGWDELDDDLRSVALARIANPTATLAEVGELCDPPVSKSAVHRRLRRLEELAAEWRD